MAIETNRVNLENETSTERSVPQNVLRNEQERQRLERERSERERLERDRLQRERSEREHPVSYETAHKIAAGGIGLSALLGLVSIVLAILGLVHVAPYFLAGITAIAMGVAFLLSGGFSKEWFTAPREHFFYEGEGAMSTDVMAGVGGIVLGILALLGVNANVLLPVSVLAFGVSLFMSSWIGASHFSGIKCLTGLAGIVLGILALTSSIPITLTLVGFLTLGFGTLFSGSIMSGKYMYAASGA